MIIFSTMAKSKTKVPPYLIQAVISIAGKALWGIGQFQLPPPFFSLIKIFLNIICLT